MSFPHNIIINADDLGLNENVNEAILLCYKEGYINSSSIISNMAGFEHCIEMVHNNPVMTNLGVHINLAEGQPLTAINFRFLNGQGCWDVAKTGKLTNVFDKQDRLHFMKEIDAQIERVLDYKIQITHLDSHYHLHTFPCYYNIFIKATQKYKLKLRLAQTYNEGNYFKYLYRRFVNYTIVSKGLNYSENFETVERFIDNAQKSRRGVTEIMLHPGLDDSGNLTDHYDRSSMLNWLDHINQADGDKKYH